VWVVEGQSSNIWSTPRKRDDQKENDDVDASVQMDKSVLTSLPPQQLPPTFID